MPHLNTKALERLIDFFEAQRAVSPEQLKVVIVHFDVDAVFYVEKSIASVLQVKRERIGVAAEFKEDIALQAVVFASSLSKETSRVTTWHLDLCNQGCISKRVEGTPQSFRMARTLSRAWRRQI